ncbi:MAG: 2-amino-4-hydroxy-6-hydroxymethyldihydropteridine diphosphokinase [Pseudomonadales bacterium]|nr:2-amino-4-hydroxy-6-hydroxymethyldihydropteridine diphosphokinase [Pseudomonadales bacterium]
MPAHTAYIAFGSNLSSPEQQIRHALTALAALAVKGTSLSVSSLYASKAIGPGEQPDYINGVCQLTTELQADALLTALQAIETSQGRTRSVKNAARTLDLDILLFDQLCCDQPRLSLPHPRMHLRNFVIMPLLEIAPNLSMPDGQALSTLADRLDWQDLKKLNIQL